MYLELIANAQNVHHEHGSMLQLFSKRHANVRKDQYSLACFQRRSPRDGAGRPQYPLVAHTRALLDSPRCKSPMGSSPEIEEAMHVVHPDQSTGGER